MLQSVQSLLKSMQKQKDVLKGILEEQDVTREILEERQDVTGVYLVGWTLGGS